MSIRTLFFYIIVETREYFIVEKVIEENLMKIH